MRFLKVYIMPAAVLQSVMVGGGYGTGREVVEFISSAGPTGGFGAILLILAIWAVLISLSFELARMMQSYDYRSFLKGLIGRAWVLYEILAIVTLALVLAVVLSASSQLIYDIAAVPKIYSVIAVILTVAWVLRYGAPLVEGVLSVWAFLVSAFLVLIFAFVSLRHGADMWLALQAGGINEGWHIKGGTFALYNVALIPILLYTLTEIRTRSEAVISGVIAAAAAILPAIMMHLTFLSAYPAVLDEPLPMYMIVSGLGAPLLVAVYFIVLLGTIIQTAIGALEGVAERIDGWLQDQRGVSFGPRGRFVLGGAMLIMSALLSSLGVIDLVAKGYGTVAWGFLAVYVIPVLTIGLWRFIKRQ